MSTSKGWLAAIADWTRRVMRDMHRRETVAEVVAAERQKRSAKHIEQAIHATGWWRPVDKGDQ